MTTLDQFLGSESHKPFANWLQNQGVIRIASLKWETEATVEGLTRSTIKVRLRTAVRACLERLLLACKDLGVLKKHDVIGAIPLCRKIGLIYAGEGFRATSCQGNLLVTENDGKKAMESAVLAAVMAGRDSNSVEAHPALVAFLVKTGLNLIRRAARKELELLKEEQKKNDNIEWRRSPPDLADLVTDYLGRLTRLACVLGSVELFELVDAIPPLPLPKRQLQMKRVSLPGGERLSEMIKKRRLESDAGTDAACAIETCGVPTSHNCSPDIVPETPTSADSAATATRSGLRISITPPPARVDSAPTTSSGSNGSRLPVLPAAQAALTEATEEALSACPTPKAISPRSAIASPSSRRGRQKPREFALPESCRAPPQGSANT